MTDPEILAARVRAMLADRDDVDERSMVGGIVFLVGGNMCCGADTEGAPAMTLRVVIRGRLAPPSTEHARRMHDEVVAATRGVARSQGIVSHELLMSLADPHEVMAIDTYRAN